VELQKKDPTRVSIFVDGHFAFGVDSAIAAEYGLYRGAVVRVDQMRQVLEADRAVRAYHAALNLLSFQMRTVEEIRRRLARKGFDSEAIDKAVENLTEGGYLDDKSLARDYAGSRVRNRGEGLHRIRRDLLRRGVDSDIVEDVVAQLKPEVDWVGAAREEATRRWERLASTKDPLRRRKKLFDFLVRRGFDYDVARRVTEEFRDSAEGIEP
jgi:regulatory protein